MFKSLMFSRELGRH